MNSIKNITYQLTLRDILLLCATFLGILLAAKFGQFIFYNWETSPAVLWPATGIGLSIMWFGGYRFAIPIFFALLVSVLTSPIGYSFPTVITTPLGQVLEQMAGVLLLRYYGFDGTFETVRNVLIFLIAIVVVNMIGPTISTLISIVTNNQSVAAYISWSRSWAGYTFSCLILTPLIMTWWNGNKFPQKNSVLESVFVGFILIVSVYFLFWTRVASDFSFISFTLFFIAHFWIGYRFPTKIVTLALFITTIVGILGLFISPNPERLLNEQLFATELFLFLVAPIFYAFSALVKERSGTTNELQIAIDKIERENIVKNNFISVLAHELRNPLAPIKTTLEILGELKLDKDIQDLIESAHHQVHSMRRLLDDLLDVSRVTQGKFQLQIESSNLCKMINHAVNLTESQFNRNQTFVMQPTCDDLIWLNVDPVRFEQALVNILNNAAKYTGEGGRIEIGTVTKDNTLEVKISDNGIGIAPEHIENIFDAFWQVKDTQRSSGGGIGVGLSLTKHIIELHGGSIKAESAGVGSGSTFTITVPFQNNDLMKTSPMKNVNANPGHFKILVVDDSHAAADSLSKLLTLKGHMSNTAYTGTDAISIVKTFDPDIVLLDIGLPDMTGYEVAQAMRANGFTKQIVALSGYGQKEDKDKALESGCDLHLTKPMAIARFDEYLATLQSKISAVI